MGRRGRRKKQVSVLSVNTSKESIAKVSEQLGKRLLRQSDLTLRMTNLRLLATLVTLVDHFLGVVGNKSFVTVCLGRNAK